ncbi:MAG: SDR family oxidoreductase [Polyangiales bacterium]
MTALRSSPPCVAVATPPGHEAKMDLHGKLAIVTGSNAGIGRVTAEALAKGGALVLLANRSAEKTAPVVKMIVDAGGKAEHLQLDLADFASVRAAAEKVLARGVAVDLLVNNAGLAGVRGMTKEGFEIAFGTNHLGHYLLTRLILPAIEKSPSARVVTVASKAHYRADPIDWELVRKPTQSTAGLPEYGTSKLANVLFSSELSRRVPAHVHTYALHPGVVASDIWRGVPWGFRHVMKLFMLTNEDGAKTTLHCATSDEAGKETGLYYDTSRVKAPSKVARDPALAKDLWDRSADWVGLPR